jgi:hypothetical protein
MIFSEHYAHAYGIWVGKMKGRDHSEDLREDGRITLRLINRMERSGLDSSGSG